MTAREFCYWLQGYFEVDGNERRTLTDTQVECVKKHLSLVFVHEIDPSQGPAEHQAKLNQLHSSGASPTSSTPRC